MLIAYVRGTSRAPFDALAGLAAGVGVSLDWLATGEGPMRRDRGAAEAAQSQSQGQTHAQPTAVPSPPVPEAATSAGQPLDGALLGLCFEGIKRTYRDVNARIDDRSAGVMAARLYDDVVAATAGEPDPESARRIALRLALQQLRRDLQTAPTAAADAGKHSA
ncbi:hypothetical protein [Roseospira navarrensis]|uniref:HTH cro/C1-type domain-containing protein n=1 Tax=Roseospira navarrensis TaxID=140058 RepID=A0A7X2D3K5_9PROT|nr:hypothetical protein [Roseospira navarrensis]MQX36861.1 hypothetical protein [Roseospira navarrensis]